MTDDRLAEIDVPAVALWIASAEGATWIAAQRARALREAAADPACTGGYGHIAQALRRGADAIYPPGEGRP